MADVNEELLKALDGPAPQHIEKDTKKPELSYGSNNAIHSKIVDQNGVPFEKVPTADADLQAKIDALNAKVDGIIDGTTPAATQLSGRNVKLNVQDADSNTTIAAGSSEIVMVKPPNGYISDLKSIYFAVPDVGNATTGSHLLRIYQRGWFYYRIAEIESNHNDWIRLRGGQLETGTLNTPSSFDILFKNLQSIVFSPDMPLQLEYINNTDADQTNTRNAQVLSINKGVI